MAESTMGGAPARPGLFLRNATGLVKAWSTFDAFIYSFWSINLITLGLYGMSFVYTVPDGQLVAGILLFGVLVTFLVITYAMLVSVMPRTGGDYAWQSRVLGGGLGFVLSITGWWFTLSSGRRSTPTSWSCSSSPRWLTRWAGPESRPSSPARPGSSFRV